jgi:hypothetical protein
MIYSRSPIIWGEDYDILDPAKVSTFVQLPYPQVLSLAESRSAIFAVLMELAWKYFEQKCNPIKYKGSRISRYARRRGLKILEREKWISVEQEQGKAPMVTLRWLKRTRAGSAHTNPGGFRTKPGRVLHKTCRDATPPVA